VTVNAPAALLTGVDGPANYRPMPTVTVTRRVHFNAAHRLHNPALTDEENRQIFGACNNPNYHGHNYELEVSVTGEVDPVTGYVVDLGSVKAIVEALVLSRLDHRNLNLDVPDFAELNPTTENLVVVIWRLLEGRLPGTLTRLVLWETPRNSVAYEGR
jgi:6-pyruvoyltetrahydropterin/6-carboxytetrahydropterin synthase